MRHWCWSIQGTDEKTVAKFFDMSLALFEEELTRQGAKEMPARKKYAGVEVVEFTKELLAARIGDAILLANKDEPMKAALDQHEANQKDAKAKNASNTRAPAEAKKILPNRPARLALGQHEADQGIAAGQRPVQDAARQCHSHAGVRGLSRCRPPIRLHRRRLLPRQGRFPSRCSHARRPRRHGDGCRISPAARSQSRRHAAAAWSRKESSLHTVSISTSTRCIRSAKRFFRRRSPRTSPSRRSRFRASSSAARCRNS